MPTAIQIQPIGDYFQNDKDGYVVNPASRNKIPVHWHPVIELVKQSYIDHLGENLHSIYLRDSLVRGMAIDGFSDLDSFAVVLEPGKYWETAFWKNELNSSLSSEYDFVGDIELMLISFHNSFFQANPFHSMIIKTQSLCIFGEDLSGLIPKFRPDKSMLLNYRWIESDFREFLTNNEMSEPDLKDFLKVVIRTGYEIVMENENRYTPDLYLCYKSFSDYFPEWGQAMEKALNCYINPSNYNDKIRQDIIELGKWLIEKVKTRLL